MKTRISVNLRRFLFATGFILMLIASGTASSDGREVYRWVDKDGVVHFTHKPPNAQVYDKVKPNIGKIGTVAPPEPQSTVNVAPQAQQAEAATQKPGADQRPPEFTAEELATACKRASANIAQLEPVTNVIINDGSGGTRRLDDAERLDWLEKSRTFMNENCN